MNEVDIRDFGSRDLEIKRSKKKKSKENKSIRKAIRHVLL